jgi:hypothetical protein
MKENKKIKQRTRGIKGEYDEGIEEMEQKKQQYFLVSFVTELSVSQAVIA